MPRQPNIIPSVLLHTSIPMDVRQRLDSHLCDRSGKVPQGAYAAWITKMVNKEFPKAKEETLARLLSKKPAAMKVAK